MAIIGYVRVSTDDQTTDNQKKAIAEVYNVEEWFSDDGVSGTKQAMTRKGFKAMFDYIRKNDTLIVTAIDRLGRGVIDVRQTVDALQAKGVKVISMREGYDLSTATGKAMYTIMATLAELELANMAERRTAGIKRAQSEGVHCGRPKKADSETVKALFEAGKTWQEIAAITGLSKASIYRLRKAK
ncbi:recombinase family protein [Salmonella enterica]|nr:recombinase family protein [Salmonella enterica]